MKKKKVSINPHHRPLYGLSITDFENLRSSTKHDSVGWSKIGV